MKTKKNTCALTQEMLNFNVEACACKFFNFLEASNNLDILA